MSRALRNAALDYADRGWAVVPLKPRGKMPLGRIVPNGLSQATSDLATVLRWWRAEPRANIGIVAKPSDLIILDVDPDDGGDDTLYELERELGALPETVRQESGGGGAHYLYRHPGGDFRGKLGDGLDIRDQAYIVAAPSIHPETGRTYEWDLAPGDVPVVELPEPWLERMRPTVARRQLDLQVNSNHSDALRNVPAALYVPAMTRRTITGDGWAQCPFHKGGKERTPSLKVEGTVWSCFGACDPIGGRQVMGGNIYDLAALLAGYPIPLRGPDFLDVQSRLRRLFNIIN